MHYFAHSIAGEKYQHFADVEGHVWATYRGMRTPSAANIRVMVSGPVIPLYLSIFSATCDMATGSGGGLRVDGMPNFLFKALSFVDLREY